MKKEKERSKEEIEAHIKELEKKYSKPSKKRK